MTTKKNKKLLSCPIIGIKKYMSLKVLPTKMDVLKHYLCISEKESILNLCEPIIEIWQQTKIPHISRVTVKQNLKKNFIEYKNIKRSKEYYEKKKPKNPDGKTVIKKRSGLSEKIKNFQLKCNTLFDIATCKCKKKCICKPEHKIPSDQKLIKMIKEQFEKKNYNNRKILHQFQRFLQNKN